MQAVVDGCQEGSQGAKPLSKAQSREKHRWKCAPSGELMERLLTEGKEICKKGNLFMSSRWFRHVLEGGNGQLISHWSKGRITVVLEESPAPYHCGEQRDELLSEYHTFALYPWHTFALWFKSSLAARIDKHRKIYHLPWSYILGLFINKTCPLVPQYHGWIWLAPS